MSKCVICDKELPPKRKKKDTCSYECAIKKVHAWAMFLKVHSKRLLEEAVKEFG